MSSRRVVTRTRPQWRGSGRSRRIETTRRSAGRRGPKRTAREYARRPRRSTSEPRHGTALRPSQRIRTRSLPGGLERTSRTQTAGAQSSNVSSPSALTAGALRGHLTWSASPSSRRSRSPAEAASRSRPGPGSSSRSLDRSAQLVVPAEPVDLVRPAPAGKAVRAAVADDDVRAGPAGDVLDVGADVVALQRLAVVRAVADRDPQSEVVVVVGGGVAPIAAGMDVGAVPAQEGVVAVAAEQLVAAAVALQTVPRGPASSVSSPPSPVSEAVSGPASSVSSPAPPWMELIAPSTWSPSPAAPSSARPLSRTVTPSV
jgi:hypothetical protein